MSGTSIEDSLTIAPRDEWVLFCNRDKFDLVTIYDGSSETFGVQDSPTASLVRAIYENEFRKYLKNLPVLMVGGLEAWKREFAGAHVASTPISATSTPGDNLKAPLRNS